MVPRFSNPLNVAGNIARDKLHGIPDVPPTSNILFHDPDHRLTGLVEKFPWKYRPSSFHYAIAIKRLFKTTRWFPR